MLPPGICVVRKNSATLIQSGPRGCTRGDVRSVRSARLYVVEVEDYHTYVTFAEKAEQEADKVGITGQRALSTEPVEFSHEIALIRGRPHSLAEVVSELIRLQDGLAALDTSDPPSVQRVLTDMNKMIHKLRALAKSRGEKIEDA
jgi:hypothetical protein